MMLLKRFWLLVFCCLPFGSLLAQVYTDKNRINILLEGHKQVYSYTSEQMLVRLDETTGRLECLLNVTTLRPNDQFSDPMMAEDIFYARKFPQFRLVLFLPQDKVTANNISNITLETITVKAQLYFQGLTRDIEIPVQFNTNRNYITFNTSFSFTLQDMQALVPQIYLNMLTGLIRVNIVNATWIDSRLIDPDRR